MQLNDITVVIATFKSEHQIFECIDSIPVDLNILIVENSDDLVAEDDDKVIGISFFFIRYSTWKGKFLFLEDFVLKESYRGKGVGALLFEKTIKIALEMKAKGMTWQVLDWNEPAINFYKKYNAQIDDQWLNGKLNEQQLINLSQNENL